MCAIHVQPDASLFAELTNRLEIIEAAGSSRSGRGDDSHHLSLFMRKAIERLSQCRRVHAVGRRRHNDDVAHPNTKLARRACDSVVHVLAANERSRIRADASFPGIRQLGPDQDIDKAIRKAL